MDEYNDYALVHIHLQEMLTVNTFQLQLLLRNLIIEQITMKKKKKKFGLYFKNNFY